MNTRLVPGLLVADRYSLVAPWPDLGGGEAWKALDTSEHGRLVALKFLRGDAPPDALEPRIAALRALRHGNVLTVRDHGSFDGRPFVVHPAFDAPSLGAGLASDPADPLPVALVARIFDRVMAAVECAHGAPLPVVHGSLDPRCVLVRRVGPQNFELRVADFGLGAWLDAPGEPRPFAPWHCRRAPELTGGAAATPAADVFGLGELVRVLFGASSSFDRPRGDVPAALWDVMRAATVASPLDRIPSVEAFRARVREAWNASERSAVSRSALPPEPVAAVAVAPVAEPSVTVLPLAPEPARVEPPPEYEAPTVMEHVSSGAWETEVEPPEGATILQAVYEDAVESDAEDEAPSATVTLTVEAPVASAWDTTGTGDESTLIVEVPASRAPVAETESAASPEIAPTDICAVTELPYRPTEAVPTSTPTAPPVVHKPPVVTRPSAVTGPSPRRAMSTDERRTVIALATLGAVIVALVVAIAVSLARG